ncbi:uncharacterized protein LOC128093667 [Culex pipiens pallens]|uniref:uncharacterized protein LOC128093667 n=1 Tax=Culex pipiens pallens TaxID=42434 RepID=UPI0022AB033B|nr:uncharacterized protein LOC128093667 [Culex pipiens pallens]
MMRSTKTSPAPTTIDALPSEILRRIFRNLLFRDRKTASRVCHQWYEIAMDCNSIAFHVRLYDTKNTYTISEIMNCKRPYKFLRVSYNMLPSRILNKFSNFAETLRISSMNAYMASEEQNFLGQLYRLKNLKRLILDCTFVPDNLQTNKHTCNNLRELIAYEVSFANFVNFNDFIAAAFPELTKLVLTECDFDVPLRFSNLPALKQLVIECGTPFDCTLLKDLGSLPNLHAFKLSCSQLDGIEQRFQLHHITKLDLTVRVGDCQLVRMAEIFPALTSLNVAAREEYLSADVEGRVVEKLPRNCELKLRKLSDFVTDFTISGFNYFE